MGHGASEQEAMMEGGREHLHLHLLVHGEVLHVLFFFLLGFVPLFSHVIFFLPPSRCCSCSNFDASCTSAENICFCWLLTAAGSRDDILGYGGEGWDYDDRHHPCAYPSCTVQYSTAQLTPSHPRVLAANPMLHTNRKHYRTYIHIPTCPTHLHYSPDHRLSEVSPLLSSLQSAVHFRRFRSSSGIIGNVVVLACFNSTESPVLSTCPLHTNSGFEKERRILIGAW